MLHPWFKVLPLVICASACSATPVSPSHAPPAPPDSTAPPPPTPLTLFDLGSIPAAQHGSACDRVAGLQSTTPTYQALVAFSRTGNSCATPKRLLDDLRMGQAAARISDGDWADLLRRVQSDPRDPSNDWIVKQDAGLGSAAAHGLDELTLPDGPAQPGGTDPVDCLPAGDGAWALIAEWVPSGEIALRADSGRLMVHAQGEIVRRFAYVRPSGLVRAFTPLDTHGLAEAKPHSAYDLDGDKTPEGIFKYEFYNEGETTTTFWVLTFRDDRPYSYTLRVRNGSDAFSLDRLDSFTLQDISDKTGDGRPDLSLAAIVYDTACGSWFNYESHALVLIAEGLPDGTFDLRSAGAIEHARRACPRPPATIDSGKAVACAKLWGIPEWQIAKRAGLEKRPRPNCPDDKNAEDMASQYRTAAWDALHISLPFRLSDFKSR